MFWFVMNMCSLFQGAFKNLLSCFVRVGIHAADSDSTRADVWNRIHLGPRFTHGAECWVGGKTLSHRTAATGQAQSVATYEDVTVYKLFCMLKPPRCGGTVATVRWHRLVPTPRQLETCRLPLGKL